jgi:hypothetical protein
VANPPTERHSCSVTKSLTHDRQLHLRRLVLAWWHLHRTELLEDWNLAQAGASLKKIEPLD